MLPADAERKDPLDELSKQVATLTAAVERLADLLGRASKSPSVAPQGKDQARRLGISEMAIRLAVSRKTIGRWYKAGKLPLPHYLGAHRRWWLHEVEAWEATLPLPSRAAPERLIEVHRKDRP